MVQFVPERVWVDRSRYLEAEQNLFQGKGLKSGDGSVLTKQSTSKETINQQHQENPFISEINKVRHFIQNSLNSSNSVSDTRSSADDNSVNQRISSLENENKELRNIIDELTKRVANLEVKCSTCTPVAPKTAAPTVCKKSASVKKSEPVDDDDDDMGLFGDDDSTPSKPVVAPVKIEKKKKAPVIAKSSVVLDIKPWDDETDLVEMERLVRTIEKDGLLWGSSKLAPVAFNIKKLQIVCVVEDDKVSIEELTEEIEAFEDYVQSVDVAAFNKI